MGEGKKEKVKQLSEYTLDELSNILKHSARQVGTIGTAMILKEILTKAVILFIVLLFSFFVFFYHP